MNNVQFLNIQEVEKIYSALVQHFEDNGEPIKPSGIRDRGLLESAVSRQFTGSGELLKYPEPRHNAAALLHSLCLNHPFFNGNKRTSLVSALVHLERNGFIPDQVAHEEFYNMVMAVADHNLSLLPTLKKEVKQFKKNKIVFDNGRLHFDQEVFLIEQWLRKKTRKVDLHEKPITWRQLRQILKIHNCGFEGPNKGFVKITGPEIPENKTIFGIPVGTKMTRVIKTYSYPGDNFQINIPTVKKIRHDFNLTPENGVDSKSFYSFDAVVDFVLSHYRGVLKRLSRR